MATYKSESVSLRYSPETVFNKLSNLEGLRSVLQNVPSQDLPDDQRQALENINVTEDTIEIPGGPVGSVMLRVTRREPYSLIVLEGEGTPVPLSLSLHIDAVGADACSAFVQIDIEIPAMLKPMVSGPLKKMTEQFAKMISIIPFDK